MFDDDQLRAMLPKLRELRDQLIALEPQRPLTVEELMAEPSDVANRRRVLGRACGHLGEAVLDLRGALDAEAAADRLMGGAA